MIYFVLTRYLFDPVAWVFYLMVAALIAGHYRRAKTQDHLTAIAALLLVCLMVLPVDQVLSRPLENQYPRRPPPPAHVDGIVILDNSANAQVFATRHVQGPNAGVIRILAGADLARRYPSATLIYSGTAGGTPGQRAAELAAVQNVFALTGIAPGRITFERTSRDTGENLANSMKLVHPGKDQTWILVTSAIHMPRAMAIARKLGWKMVPWPSDYISTPTGRGYRIAYPSEGLMDVDRALHEWIGLLFYRLTGRASG